ncbi:Calcium and integrin-binding protein 1 [Galemys pyrenaicus]|uniref:Calcium and integrin-binding protein 1 n=1 Tax=Galemys pyrenaicus TaxID=202257 RepID=A0A8J6A8G6_GALPY|nr:Calcium and integrin-binding protein 1 [Galemys pyrenaicus]
MGGSGSRLSKELLAEYQDLTFLTKQEILLAHRRFCELLPPEHRGVEESLRVRVSLEQVLGLPELKVRPPPLLPVLPALAEPEVWVWTPLRPGPSRSLSPQANPFRERICRVFSTSPTRDSLSFEDLLDLLSVFSDTATPDVKSHYAFRIFDFDDDGTLNREDLSRLVNCLTGEGEDTQLSAPEMKQLVDNILEESDIDRDGTINLSEFQHVISRSPDFARWAPRPCRAPLRPAAAASTSASRSSCWEGPVGAGAGLGSVQLPLACCSSFKIVL